MWIVSPGIASAGSLPNTWQPAPSLPTPSSESAAVTGPDGDIYFIGGGSPTGFLATTLRYDSAIGGWQTLAPMPTARDAVAGATGHDGKIYVFGGATNSGVALSTVEAYDPGTNTWTCSSGDSSTGCTSSTISPMPTGRYGLAAVTAANGRIYVIGGFGPGIVGVVEAYDPNTNTWSCSTGDSGCVFARQTLGPPLATPRAYLGAALGSNGTLYVIGGGGISSPELSSVEMYTPSTSGTGWKPAASLHTARFALATAVGTDGRIYAIGGYNGGFLSSVEAYDPTNNAAGWSNVGPMQTAREYLEAAAASDGRIYAIGGSAGGEVSAVEAYAPGPQSALFGRGPVGVIGLQAGTALPAATIQAGVVGAGTIGGYFSGSRVQLHLVPGSTVGHPTSGHFLMGDIYLDKAGNLFVCVLAGTPCGRWKQVTTTIAP